MYINSNQSSIVFYFREQGVFHLKPLTFMFGLGDGYIGKIISFNWFCFGCICGHLEEETDERHSQINVKSFLSKFHIGECCTCRITKADPDEEDQTVSIHQKIGVIMGRVLFYSIWIFIPAFVILYLIHFFIVEKNYEY